MKMTKIKGIPFVTALLVAFPACAHWTDWGGMQPGHMRTEDRAVQTAQHPMVAEATPRASLKADGVDQDQMRMLLDMMGMMRDMMESMKSMAVDPSTQHKMDEMMKRMDDLLKQHRAMMKEQGMSPPPVLH